MLPLPFAVKISKAVDLLGKCSSTLVNAILTGSARAGTTCPQVPARRWFYYYSLQQRKTPNTPSPRYSSHWTRDATLAHRFVC